MPETTETNSKIVRRIPESHAVRAEGWLVDASETIRQLWRDI